MSKKLLKFCVDFILAFGRLSNSFVRDRQNTVLLVSISNIFTMQECWTVNKNRSMKIMRVEKAHLCAYQRMVLFHFFPLDQQEWTVIF